MLISFNSLYKLTKLSITLFLSNFAFANLVLLSLNNPFLLIFLLKENNFFSSLVISLYLSLNRFLYSSL